MNWKNIWVKSLLLLGVLSVPIQAQSPSFFVDASAPIAGANGLSWATAFPALELALSAAALGDNIWVAEGVYTPRTTTIPGIARSQSFIIPPGVNVFGGFDGTETTFDQRTGLFDQTILSGEIGTAALTDNTYHVLTMRNNFFPNTVDGFVIRDGYAIGGPSPDGGAADTFNRDFAWFRNVTFENNTGRDGGALSSNLSQIFTSKCTFRGNFAIRDGGAVSVRLARYLSSHCEYFENVARRRGGAVSVRNQSQSFANRSILSNCVLDDNISVGRGGAINVAPGSQISSGASTPGGNLAVSNCTVHGNMSINAAGGGLWANESAPIPPTIVVDNSIFWNNGDGTAAAADDQIGGVLSVDFCDVQGGFAGLSNISQNPLFVDAAADDFSLISISPCRNAADNARLQRDILDIDDNGVSFFEPNPLDINFTTRVRQGIVDIGAAETFLGDAGGGEPTR